MTPELFLKTGICPALLYLKPFSISDTPAARREMLAIALQESRLAHRRQVSNDGTESGPAVSFYQAEMTGAAYWLLRHAKAGPILKKACADFNVEPTAPAIWEAIRYQDVLASIVARLNLWVLPSALPDTQEQGWAQYLAAWQPGKPKQDTWSTNWSAADLVVRSNP